MSRWCRRASALALALVGLALVGLAPSSVSAAPGRASDASVAGEGPGEAPVAATADRTRRLDLTLDLTLDLGEVLGSVTRADPRLEAAERGRDLADAKLLEARGGFDTTAKIRGIMQPLGAYRYGVVDVRFEQPTPLWGLSVWAGWRVGLGDFAIYDEKLRTAAGGELRAGATLPLWRDGPIDRRRADLKQARLGQDRAGHQRDAKQLALELEAARAYWSWVAAGLELEIELELLATALERDAGLRRQIELGDVEAIVGTDNGRQILAREARVVGAERAFQAAALSLSLFLRDEAGAPVVVGADRLPRQFPAVSLPASVDVEAEIAAALERRPDRAAIEAARAQAEVELRYAKNQRSARIDLSSWVSQDLGPGPLAARPVEVAAAVELEIPIPLRKARGRYRAAQAELGRVDADLRFVHDRIAAEVRDAHSALSAADQQARLAGEQVELARELARAELRRFELGAGDLLLVNLRELATADAARAEVEALADYFEALARLDVALGRRVGDG